MARSKLTIPCHWDKSVLNKILDKQKFSKSDIKVSEIYGTLAKGPVLHGRAWNSIPNITKKEAVAFRRYVKSLGLKFTYLLNAPYRIGDSKDLSRVKDYLKWIVEEFEADSLMVTSHGLMNFIREIYPFIPLYISTIAGVLNFNQLENFLDINPSRVVVHHDANRNFKDLTNLVKKAQERNVEVEVMATESCLRRCPHREAHYNHLGSGRTDVPFHTICNKKKLMYPKEFLKANFIRPEDLHFYEKIGINFFKITGRSKPSSWLPKAVKAYLERSYEGNLMRLLGTDPSLKVETWIFINNKSLDGFLDSFPRDKNEKKEDFYCDEWISKMYTEGRFKVEDGTKYELNSSRMLRFCQPGYRASSIITPEK